MLKLLLCIVCGTAMAIAVLQLRQQKVELLHQCSALHSEMEEIQLKLWNQQLQIASSTAPLAIRQTMQSYKLTLVPSNSDVPQVELSTVKESDVH
jgi:hypothetical protein